MAQERQQRRLGVSLSQVIAGTLASVSAAVVASYFGIAGTLIGAATTSIVIIVGGALYQRTLEQTQVRLVRTWRNPRTGGITREVVTEAAPATGRGRIRWGTVLAGLGAVLSLTFGAVTAVELLAQQPLAAMVQQQAPPAEQTTLGAATRGVVHEVTDPPPAPTVAPTRPALGTVRPTATAQPESPPSATSTAARTPTPTRRTAVPTTVPPTAVSTQSAPTAIPTTVVPTAALPTAVPTPPASSVTPRPGTPAPP
jgi:hypothetical protein